MFAPYRRLLHRQLADYWVFICGRAAPYSGDGDLSASEALIDSAAPAERRGGSFDGSGDRSRPALNTPLSLTQAATKTLEEEGIDENHARRQDLQSVVELRPMKDENGWIVDPDFFNLA